MAEALKMALLSLALILLMTAQCQATAQKAQSQQSFVNSGRSLKQSINCPSACDYRCSKANAHENCIKYCNICCEKCECVPPGTYGNKETCPCYNNMKNSKGGSKCP